MNRKNINIVSSLIITLVGLFAACMPAHDTANGPATDPGECAVNSDCPSGQKCNSMKECVDIGGTGGTTGGTGGTSSGCTMDTQCTNGRICENGDCVTPSSGGTGGTSSGCSKDTDCTNGRICDNGECKNPPSSTGGTGGTSNSECTKDTDCPDNCICENGTCVTQNATGGTGGSTGGTNSTGGTGGSSGSCSAGLRSVTFRISGDADQKYMMGAEVEKGDHRPDAEIKWYQDWHSYGGDVFGNDTYEVTVQWCGDNSLRFQGYLKNPTSGSGVDEYHYVCDLGDTGLKTGETFSSSQQYVVVENLHNGNNCQID